jgi:CrcB-like protein involved in camphor resistance
MRIFLLVALAGAAGATARYGLDLTFSRDAHHVPWVTFAINVGGSFLLGAVVAVLDAHPHPTLRPANHDRAARRLHDVLDPVAGDVPAARPRTRRARVRVLAREARRRAGGGDARRLRSPGGPLSRRRRLAPPLEVA